MTWPLALRLDSFSVMHPVNVFFFRGLSTYGHDNAKWSVFDFGPIYKHLTVAFEKRGIALHPLVGLGKGSIVEIADRAKKQIEAHPVWKAGEPVFFLGHSAGGLAARLVLEKMRHENRIRGCLTIATPNKGAAIARLVLDLPSKYRGSNLILRSFGYDISQRTDFFSELTKEGLAKIFKRPWSDPRLASVVCWHPRHEWCLPLKMIYRLKAFNDFDLPSDGFVERDSQDLGRVIAELSIDHVRQVGLFDDGRRFNQMCDVVAEFFKGEA